MEWRVEAAFFFLSGMSWGRGCGGAWIGIVETIGSSPFLSGHC